jgi:hypothetical protein
MNIFEESLHRWMAAPPRRANFGLARAALLAVFEG